MSLLNSAVDSHVSIEVAKHATARDIVDCVMHGIYVDCDENVDLIHVPGGGWMLRLNKPEEYPNPEAYALLLAIINEADHISIGDSFNRPKIVDEILEIIHEEFLYGTDLFLTLMTLGLRDNKLDDAVAKYLNKHG